MLIRSGRPCKSRSQSRERTSSHKDRTKKQPETRNRSEPQKQQQSRTKIEEQERKNDKDQQRIAKWRDDLDKEFEKNIKILERAVCPMDFRPKVMATMWITKLRTPPQSAEDAKARNIIAAHLVKCMRSDVFEHEPFNQAPSADNFVTIKREMNLSRESTCRLFPRMKVHQKHSTLQELFKNSYDGGQYLKSLPVPRDGSFFVLHMRPNL